ncbi:MATE family efflux transporter [Alphaproteobacteria bacterium]|nr:MATE family efflux transporter [Alphaproteobacteria bacterium]
MPLVIIADVYFISQLGNISLASLALVFPFISLMQMMSAGAIGGATTSSISRFTGAGLNESANSAAWHAVIIAVIFSVFYTVIFVFFPKLLCLEQLEVKRFALTFQQLYPYDIHHALLDVLLSLTY